MIVLINYLCTRVGFYHHLYLCGIHFLATILSMRAVFCSINATEIATAALIIMNSSRSVLKAVLRGCSSSSSSSSIFRPARCCEQLLKHLAQRRTLSTSLSALSAAVTQPAPAFKGQAVVDGQFKEISLADYAGKYLVLFFYPLDFTFVCPTELIAFSDRMAEFKALDCGVVGVSTDSHFSHLAWINMPKKQGGLGGLSYPLLSDFSKTISRDYGVLLEADGVALRGLFLVNPKGVVSHLSINDLPVGRSVDETLRLVKAFQFVEKHGEVCPANWQPESPTIKPDPKASLEYFNKVN